MLGLLLRCLLYKGPRIHLTPEECQSYDRLLESLAADTTAPATITYQLPYPKSRFLYHASQSDKYIFHGSNRLDINVFEPRQQTLYNGQVVQAIFATIDPIWPVFYATLNRSKLKGNMRNACLEHKGDRYHFYSLTRATMNEQDIWTDGMIYFLPRDRFKKSGHGKVIFDEWICEHPVAPLAKLPVTAEDFIFQHKVGVHADDEALLLTYLKYKWRTRNGKIAHLSIEQDWSVAK